MIDRTTRYFLLAALAALPVLAYLISKNRRSILSVRIAYVMLSLLLAAVAFVGTFGYAVDALHTFRNPQVSLSVALGENILLWGISLGAWIFALRFLARSFRKR